MENFKVSSYLSDPADGFDSLDTGIFGKSLNIEQLMVEVSRNFAKSTEFYPDCVQKAEDSNGKLFLDYFNERNHLNESDGKTHHHSMTALIGRFGAGKSSFIKWWKRKYAPMSSFILDIEVVRTACLSSPDKIEYFMIDYFCTSIRDFYQNLESDEKERISSIFSNSLMCLENSDIQKKYSGFLSGGNEPGGELLLLEVLILSLNTYLDRPLWFIIDNIDLENDKNRKVYYQKINHIYSKLVKSAKKYLMDSQFRFIVAIRPETYQAFEGKSDYDEVILYPCGDVAAIFLKKIKQSIVDVLDRHREG